MQCEAHITLLGQWIYVIECKKPKDHTGKHHSTDNYIEGEYFETEWTQ